MLCQVQMLFVVRDPIQLQTIDGISFTAGEPGIVQLEILVQPVGGFGGVIQQVSLPGRDIPGRGHFEEAIATVRLPRVFHPLDRSLDLPLQSGVRVCLQGINRRFQHVTDEAPARLGELLNFERNRDVRVGGDLGFPERVLESHFGKPLRPYGILVAGVGGDFRELDVGGPDLRVGNERATPGGLSQRAGYRRSDRQEFATRHVLVHNGSPEGRVVP